MYSSPFPIFLPFELQYDDPEFDVVTGPQNDPKRIIQNDPFWIKRNFEVLTIAQLRAARGLLGWSQSDLAERAGLSLPTVKRVEAGVGPRVSKAARAKLRQALEAANVEFIDENGGGPGVRLRKRMGEKSRR